MFNTFKNIFPISIKKMIITVFRSKSFYKQSSGYWFLNGIYIVLWEEWLNFLDYEYLYYHNFQKVLNIYLKNFVFKPKISVINFSKWIQISLTKKQSTKICFIAHDTEPHFPLVFSRYFLSSYFKNILLNSINSSYNYIKE